jgi:hypothetical protein
MPISPLLALMANHFAHSYCKTASMIRSPDEFIPFDHRVVGDRVLTCCAEFPGNYINPGTYFS